MKYCENCKKSYADDKAFCSMCGSRLIEANQVCSCGTQNSPDSVFCSWCGKKLGEQTTESKLIMTLEGLSLYQGKQPIGFLKIYNDKVEFVHSKKNYATSVLIGGLIGGMIASGTSKETDVVDCFKMSEIAVANKSKHPKISSFIEIVLKNGNKLKYLDRAGKYRAEQMSGAVDAINANL